MYKPFFHKKASNYYKSLDDKTARRVNKAIGDMTKISLWMFVSPVICPVSIVPQRFQWLLAWWCDRSVPCLSIGTYAYQLVHARYFNSHNNNCVFKRSLLFQEDGKNFCRCDLKQGAWSEVKIGYMFYVYRENRTIQAGKK